MKKNSKIIGIIILIMIIGILNKNIEARVWVVPKFEGRILDEITGKPVEKAVITVIWHGKGAESIFSMSRGSDTRIEVYITDKEGKYTIPMRISIPVIGNLFNSKMLTSFRYLELIIEHPMYVRKYAGPYIENSHENKTTYEGTKLPNGTIHYDIKLVGVEEAKGVRVTGGWTASWFKELKEKHGVRYDLNAIWNKWIEILKKDGKDINYLMKIDNDFKKLKEGIDKLLQEGY